MINGLINISYKDLRGIFYQDICVQLRSFITLLVRIVPSMNKIIISGSTRFASSILRTACYN